MLGARRLLTPLMRTLVGACVLLSCATVHAEGEVYRYRNAEGREAFTNAGKIAVAGEPLKPMQLPDLRQLDLSAASPAQLQQLDRSLQRAHDALQNGERCEAIRALSRVPASSVLWRQHLRALCMILLLFAVALVALVGWGGRLRALMPVAPLLGALYLGYVTYSRIELRKDVLREGLRACSSDLPPAQGGSPGTIKARLESALTLQAAIDHAYGLRAGSAAK